MLPFAPRRRISAFAHAPPLSAPRLGQVSSSPARVKLSGVISPRLSRSPSSRFQTLLFRNLWQRRRQASSPLKSLSSGAKGEVYEVTGDQVTVIFYSTLCLFLSSLEIAIAWLREEKVILKAAQNLKVLDCKMDLYDCISCVVGQRSILINGLCKEGEIDKAMDIVDVMISKGYDPDVITYSILINGLCKKGEIQKAMDIVDLMISKGHEPNVVSYSTLIDGLCKKGEKVKMDLYIMS